MKLDNILENNKYTDESVSCPGCDNHCSVRKFTFSEGRCYYSGNQCEKVFGQQHEKEGKGVNMFAEKYRILFKRETPEGSTSFREGITIGIPRGLGMYENYPFWFTLLSYCGIRTVLSGASSNRIYEKGIRTIVADNICFPAKLFHGHVMDLIDKKVDRILYPWVVFEQKEDPQSKNSFNCPVVSGYSDVIRSSINPEGRYGIPLDSPVISFKDEKLLKASCVRYLESLGVDRKTAGEAVIEALKAQRDYLEWLERRGLEILENAMKKGRMVIVLASRPYHIDPLIEHHVSQAIAGMGIDVITENVAASAGRSALSEINALCQWAYPNRVFKAAGFVGDHPYAGLHMVELTSFGCGPDAFILDEARSLLSRKGKNLTVLKIDDVNNIGSLKLRIRSLVESVGAARKSHTTPSASILTDAPYTTRTFTREDRHRTILIPYFAEGYTEFICSLFTLLGYKAVQLPMCSQEDAEEGLKDVNNDVCYPATLVVGSITRALKSGKYLPEETAVVITQTGGQCRASNYYSLIKDAMVNAGFHDVPVVSFAIGAGISNLQPGFVMDWKRIAGIVAYTMYYADALAKLYYPCAVREKEDGIAKRIYGRYIAQAIPIVEKRDKRGLLKLFSKAVDEFSSATDIMKSTPVVGVVGEIYVKYNSFSNKNVIGWLIDHGVEVVPPTMSSFFSTSLENSHFNRELNIKKESVPLWLMDGTHKLVNRIARKFDRIGSRYALYRPFVDISEYAKLSRQVVNPAADFGEGWLLPGEICHMAQSGITKVVSLQPFGCIANHIISKGIEKRIKDIYPGLSLLFLDFDSGTSEANVYNRLHFMLE